MVKRTVLFVGGGSGGHIFPNLAVAERLLELEPDFSPHFLVSDRSLDAQVITREGLGFTAAPAKPLTLRPSRMMAFLRGYRMTQALVRQLIAKLNVKAVVATGGFVSAPAVSAAVRARIPVAMVNLDAVPGKANRLAARKAQDVFSVYSIGTLPGAQRIGLPLRRAALAEVSPEDARRELGLQPQAQTLLIFAGSQGGRSINRMMIELCSRGDLSDWQMLHWTGPSEQESVAAAYARAGIASKVEPFCHQMGLAWAAASLAICRAGAGSVAEAWANAVPAIFLPYPYHKDEHQKHNARPLVDLGAAMMLADLIDPARNAEQLSKALSDIETDPAQLQRMQAQLAQTRQPDGARVLARWVAAKAI